MGAIDALAMLLERLGGEGWTLMKRDVPWAIDELQRHVKWLVTKEREDGSR